MLDWDDLRVFLTTGRSGSFSRAALRLGMDSTTVARRVKRLERELRCTLFVRAPHGLQLTAAGARLLESSGQVEQAMDSVQHGDNNADALGAVRISASEGFGAHILAPALPGLIARRPGLRLELVATSGFLSPSTREVDIAVTLNPVAADRLSLTRLTDYDLGLYGSPGYLARAGRPGGVDDLRRHAFVGYIDDLIYAPQLRYLDDLLIGQKPQISSSSIHAQAALIARGAGLGVLPVFLAAENAGLERVLLQEICVRRTFWIAVHQDLRTAPRIRIVMEWLHELVTHKSCRLTDDRVASGE